MDMKKYMKLLGFPTLIMALLLGVFLMSAGTNVQAASPVVPGTWNVVPSANPSTTENTLLGVAALRSSDIWAVGYYHNDSFNSTRALIERWNGTQWKTVAHPNPSTTSNFLYHVVALSGSDVWAVGRYTDSNFNQLTLIEHWNGTTWKVVASPNPSASFNTLSSITAISANNIWAVGFSVDTNGFRKTLVEHWNGRQWSVVDSPNLPGRSSVLNSIVAISANDIWAVGDAPDANGDYITLSEHWNGTMWKIVTSPNPSSTFSHLYGVTALAPNNVWAVGFYASVDTFKSLVIHWNGSKWNVVSSPNPGPDSNVLNAVTALSATNIWAVGYKLNSGTTSTTRTLIEHWNETKWSVVASPSVGTGSNFLSNITGMPGTNNVWAVGYYYDSSNSNPHTLTENYRP